MYKNSQSVKYANVTIPPKGGAYLQRVSGGYAEGSPLHVNMASNWPRCIYGVRRRETTPRLAAL